MRKRRDQLASVEHITALVALYRSPDGSHPGSSSAATGGNQHEHPLLEEISEETYGISFIKSR